jgi:IS30 family transposase
VSVSAELKAKFFEILDRVGSVATAACEAGVNRNTAYGWARKAGRRSTPPSRRHPRRDEYERLRKQGVARRRAAERVGVNERTAKDWDWGVRKTRSSRTYPDGRRVDYNTG